MGYLGKFGKWVLVFILLSKGLSLYSQLGFPLISNYSSHEFKVNPQTWAITQDDKGAIYVATNEGVLRFDGSNWQTFKVPLNSPVRSLEYGLNGNIYVGASREFGLLRPNENGFYQYVSLSDSLKEKEFSAVLKTFIVDNKVYFLASHQQIFEFDGDSLQRVDVKGFSNFRGFQIENYILLSDTSFGFAELKDGHIQSLSKGKLPGVFYFIIPYNQDFLLGGTLNNGLFLINKKNWTCTSFANDVNKELIEYNIYHGINLRNGEIAIATLKGGVFILSKSGKLVNIINKQSGILNNAVYYLFEDSFNDLWVGQEKGISLVELSVPFSKFDSNSGLEGTIQKVTLFNNNLICGTSTGIYYLPLDKKNTWEQRTFEALNTDYIYNLDHAIFKVPGQKQDYMLASCLRNLVLITPQLEVRDLYKIYGCYSIQTSKKRPGRYFLGSSSGVDVLQLNSKSEHDISVIYVDKLSKIKESIRQLLVDTNGDLWIRTAFNNILKVDFDDNEDITDYKLYNFPPFNEKKSEILITGIYQFGNKIIVTTRNGIFSTKLGNGHQLENNFTEDFSFGTNFEEDHLEILSLGKDSFGNFWMGTQKGLKKFDILKNQIIDLPYKRLSGDPIKLIEPLENSELVFVTDDMLYFYQKAYESNPLFKFQTVITQATFGANYLKIGSDGNDQMQYTLTRKIPFDQNSVMFEFSAPFYQKPEATQYSWKLEGFDKNWSPMSSLQRAIYTNLPSGDYTFSVYSTSVYNTDSSIIKFRFKIEKPWYSKPLAWLVYSILLVFLVWGVIIIYTRKLKNEKKILQQKINEAISLEEKQKKEIEMQAEELQNANLELEKLSLVASKTDNAIVVMDNRGEVEWVNDAYIKMYGFTIDELKKNKFQVMGENANISLNAMVNVWFGERKPIIFENLKQSKGGKKIWVQTTLTPILGDQKIVTKFIAIDSDISKLKIAEREIETQKSEIEAQRDMAIQQRDEIHEQKKEIIDSIYYAHRIQRAILTEEEEFKLIFPDSFIFNKPRDIVSGDFYWCYQMDHIKIVATVDCTGHGVPGAFMSLIGTTILNNIIIDKGVTEPGEILNRLKERIISSLGQTGKSGETNDGMDISICVIDTNHSTIRFAGAFNNGYLIRNKQLMELEADKMPISIYEFFDSPFKTREYQYEKGDILYLFSDGFSDQFGGIDGKKYKSRRFKNLLIAIANTPIQKQHVLLQRELDDWRRNYEQIDDILIVGIEL